LVAIILISSDATGDAGRGASGWIGHVVGREFVRAGVNLPDIPTKGVSWADIQETER
jgi:hypothetical protein